MAEQEFEIEFEGYWREPNITGIPSKSGVYCVYECTYNTTENTVTIHKLIYIGEAENASERAAQHLKGSDWSNKIRNGKEFCFSFAHVESYYRTRIEAALIFKHKPPLNDEYKYSFPFDRTTISASGKTALLSTYFTIERTS